MASKNKPCSNRALGKTNATKNETHTLVHKKHEVKLYKKVKFRIKNSRTSENNLLSAIICVMEKIHAQVKNTVISIERFRF
jgi:hypothetical protein